MSLVFNQFYLSKVERLQDDPASERWTKLIQFRLKYFNSELFNTQIDYDSSEDFELEDLPGPSKKELKKIDENDAYVEAKEHRIIELQRKYIERMPFGNENRSKKIKPKRGRWGRNPLHEAVAIGDKDAVRRLIAEKKFTLGKDNNGNTPFRMAFFMKCKEILAIFAESGICE